MPHLNYLPRHRKEYQLSQDELASLLPGASQSIVSRCESGEQRPSIEFALGCEVLFGDSPRDMFPELYREVEEAVARRAAKLDRALRHKLDATSQLKRGLLSRIALGADNHPAA